MKLIIRQYLASLRERGELDAILPDLLSQLGLIVFSRPARGTRQSGVDVAAVGSLNGGPDKVYLFSIKSGNLTRSEWDGSSTQALRPSLNEIFDSYIPSRLPAEHAGKDIVICIVLGGDISEPVREQVTNFVKSATRPGIAFEEWNGDKLAGLIQSSFLREDLLPSGARTALRKSLALLDEPESSHRHFAELIRALSAMTDVHVGNRVTVVRQMSICTWILFAWARDAANLESAYLSSEIALLHAWNLVKADFGKTNETSVAITSSFYSIFDAYQQICNEYLAQNVLPHAGKLHALSHAVHPTCSLDVNLKLFDVLGRLGLAGLWAAWGAKWEEDVTEHERLVTISRNRATSIKLLISNNPVLFLPIRDDQAIDVSIAALLLALHPENASDIKIWFLTILKRAEFAFEVHGDYPCTLRSYKDLLLHPKVGDNEYRESVTQGSILYPTISLWAALLGDSKLYAKVSQWKERHMKHCNFQLWFPDELTETHLYLDDGIHGAVLSKVPVRSLNSVTVFL